MKEIGFEELKNLQLDILINVRDFCNKHNLTYFLAYGTLIGGVRHKGYIPWDDDVDIWMPRPDYNRFLSLFNACNSVYKVGSPELNHNFYAPYANVYDTRTKLIEPHNKKNIEIGVKIDIFPIDGVPSDDEMYKNHLRKCKLFNYLRSIKVLRVGYYNGKSKFKLIVEKFLTLLIPLRLIQYLLILTVKKYNYTDCDNVYEIVFPVYTGIRFKKNLFESTISCKFEGETFNIPVGYDEVLKSIYGEYMQLPPEDKRIPHHGFKAYWK